MHHIQQYLLLVVAILVGIPVGLRAYRVIEENDEETILALKNERINIQCKSNTSIAYCGFIHPSGKRYSFSGNTLADGQCALQINVTTADSGNWICHIGRTRTGIETMKTILVRVGEDVAAVRSNVTAIHRKEVTLSCLTVKGLKPITYCRFEPPNGPAFSIDSGVTVNKSIENKYYFPPNMTLDRGDCAVTIRKVKYTDVGDWTCGVGLDDGKEYVDVITLTVDGLYTMSTASTTGITFGALGVVVLLTLLAVMAWKKRRFLWAGRRQEGEVIEIPELGELRPERTPTPSRGIPSVVVHSPSQGGASSPT